MIKMRVNKTTQNMDDFRVLLIGAICTIVIMFVGGEWEDLALAQENDLEIKQDIIEEEEL